jgi:hypothetical protein
MTSKRLKLGREGENVAEAYLKKKAIESSSKTSAAN